MGNFSLSNYIGILAMIAQGINLVMTLFVGIIPHDVAIILAGILAFIQAVSGRVQGTPTK